MPLPIVIGAAVLAALGTGAKKVFEGYESHSRADEIIDHAKKAYDNSKNLHDSRAHDAQTALEALGKLELEIGSKFNDFITLSERLLGQLNQGREKNLEISLPSHKLEQVEYYKFTALGVLGSIAAAGAGGAMAGFAIYGGVMALGAASTGTAIASLSGVAATNAALAAIGGGALGAGGLGMAGGAAILGAAVAAPVLAIMAWGYAKHGKDALENANAASKEATRAYEKLDRISQKMIDITDYVQRVTIGLEKIYLTFLEYHSRLHEIDLLITSSRSVIKDEAAIAQLFASIDDATLLYIDNGYKVAAILTDIISTPLFKMRAADAKLNMAGNIVNSNQIIPKKDSDGVLVLNKEKISEAIAKGIAEKDTIVAASYS